MKKNILFILLLKLSLISMAQQSIDLFTLSGRYALPQDLEDAPEGKATETGGLINLKVPVVFNPSTIWYTEATYSRFNVDFSVDLPEEMAGPIHANGFIVQTGLVQSLDDTRKIHLLLAPRYMTDFESSGSDNWQLGGIALFEKKFHDRLMMRFGALYNQEFFGPFMVPLVHVEWFFGNKWSLSGLLPIYGKLNYHANENLTIGLSEFGLITSYRLSKPEYKGDYIERKSIDMALFARYRIVGNMHVEGRAGYALSREYGQYAADQKVDFRISLFSFGDDRIRKNVLFEDGPIFNIRLVYNLPLEQE